MLLRLMDGVEKCRGRRTTFLKYPGESASIDNNIADECVFSGIEKRVGPPFVNLQTVFFLGVS